MLIRNTTIALLFSCGIALAQSQPNPSVGEKNQARTEQQNTAPDQRGTEKQPLFIQPLSTKKSAEEGAREATDAKEKFNSDWWTWFLSVLTVVALFGQIAVLIAQTYLFKGTLQATEEAAGAAKVAAAALPIVEGAYVYPNILKVHIADSFLGFSQVKELRQNRLVVEFEIRNFGKTPAIIQSCRADLVHSEQSGRVRAVDVDTRKVTKIILGTGEVDTQEPAEISDFKREEWLSVTSRKSDLSFVGSIVYLDIFGDRWDFSFHWRYDAASQRLIPDNQPRRKTDHYRLEPDTGRYAIGG